MAFSPAPGLRIHHQREQHDLRLQLQLTSHLHYNQEGLPPLSFYEHGYYLLYVAAEKSRQRLGAEVV